MRRALVGPLILFIWGLAMLATEASAARTPPPGSLDQSFGSGGIAGAGANTRLFGTAVQPDGKVVAVGESGVGSNPDVLLVRFTSSGALDPSFGTRGVVHGPAIGASPGSLARAVLVQPDGKIVVVGKATDATGIYAQGLIVERYDSNGELDTRFGGAGVVEALTGSSLGDGYAVAFQSNGKILAAGSANASQVGGSNSPRPVLVRLNPNGSFDTGFEGGGIDVINLGPFSYALGVALQSDGKIVIAGWQQPSAMIARLTASGALDQSFASGGVYIHQYAHNATSSAFNAVVVQPDGKIVAAGAAAAGGSGANTIVVRFTSAGVQDGSFGSGGAVYATSAVNWSAGATSSVPGANGVAIAPNGDIVTAGFFANSATSYATLWAFTPTGGPAGTFGYQGASVLTNSDNDNTEYPAIALSPSNADFVTVGDSWPFSGSYAGLAARYVGFGLPSALRLWLKGVRRSYGTSTVAKQGLKLTVGCNEACAIKVSLAVSAATARKLHLAVRGRTLVTVANATATLGAAGGHRLMVVKLSRRNAKALGRQKRVQLTLRVVGSSSAAHQSQLRERGIVFSR